MKSSLVTYKILQSFAVWHKKVLKDQVLSGCYTHMIVYVTITFASTKKLYDETVRRTYTIKCRLRLGVGDSRVKLGAKIKLGGPLTTLLHHIISKAFKVF